MKTSGSIALACVAAFLLSGCTATETGRVSSLSTGDSAASARSSLGAAREADSDVTPYPFTTCAVNQQPFRNGIPKYRRVYQGQEVLLCCTPCRRVFDSTPDPFMPRIVAAAQARVAGSPPPPGGPG